MQKEELHRKSKKKTKLKTKKIMKKAIAMKCNQKQWESIKTILKKSGLKINSVTDFNKYPYLINFDSPEELTNISKTKTWNNFWDQNPEIHEAWNEKIFLEACGISVTPTLEEIKEYFKDAAVVTGVKSIYINKERNVKIETTAYDEETKAYYCDCNETRSDMCLWSKIEGYAKILTYKQPKYEITKEQILEVSEWGNSRDLEKIKSWFPDAFKVDKKELVLETGNWCKNINDNSIAFYTGNKGKDYGINSFGEWIIDNYWFLNKQYKWKIATPEEVQSALEKEAVNRGFNFENVKGIKCLRGWTENKSMSYNTNKIVIFKYESEFNRLWLEGLSNLSICIFENGIWAEILETISKEDAEKQLNKKIV